VHGLELINVNFELDTKKVVDYCKKSQNDVTKFGAILVKRRLTVEVTMK